VQNELLRVIGSEFRRYNQFDVPDSLPWYVVADLIFELHIRPNPGNSVLDDAMLQKYIYAYNNSLTSSEVQETINQIKSLVTMDSKERKDGMERRLIAEFKHDLLTNASLECIPTTLAYDMYLGWLAEKYQDQKQEQGQGPCGRNTFLTHLRMLVNPAKDGWAYIDTNQRVHGRMNYLEPLLEQYHCTAWMQNKDSSNLLDHTKIRNVPIHARGCLNSAACQKQQDASLNDNSV